MEQLGQQIEIQVPDKKYFKIHEVSALLGLKPYVLRAWEAEFPQIKSFKSQNGQRIYRKKDVYELIKLQKLLYHEKRTIADARQALKNPHLLNEHILAWPTDPNAEILDSIEEAKEAQAIEQRTQLLTIRKQVQELRDSILQEPSV